MAGDDADSILPLIELPLGLAGRCFRSPMPLGPYDPPGRALDVFRALGVTAVVVLVSDDEARERCGLDLRRLYTELALAVIHLPVEDFGVPDVGDLDVAVATAVAHLRGGGHLAVHCNAGLGRTGTFAACLARAVLGLDAEGALAWVRAAVPGAVETVAQRQFLAAWRPAQRG